MIRWYRSREHCHRCGGLAACLVRMTWPGAATYAPRKRALCAACAPLDGASASAGSRVTIVAVREGEP